MELTKLVSVLDNPQTTGDLNVNIESIIDDSRKVSPGSLFVAIKGLTVDSHDFIQQAIEAGAVAIVGERDPQSLDLNSVPYIQVKDPRKALGKLASQWFDNPSQKLKVIGVTGTEGKTTTCSLIYHILQSSGKKTGLISTIGAKIGDKNIDTGLHVTNPEALPLQELLKEMVDQGCEYAVLETTSMGLHQGRVAGVVYNTAVLTNITSDHLDYHKTKENYREAKALLFENVDFAILNKDDDSFEFLIKKLHNKTKVVSYGVKESADFKAENIQPNASGFKFDIYHNGQTVQINSSLLGLYNVSNSMAAIATAFSQDLNFEEIKNGIESFDTPEGRLERIDEDQSFQVFVDFAHTANSVKNVLETLREVTPKDKRLITVYGAAGLRDETKRPEMGRWGAEIADITIFTTDDPRTEDVGNIIDKMVDGALETGAQEMTMEEFQKQDSDKNVFTRVTDRREAIEFALKLAKSGDVVALLGKGHEKSLAVGHEEIPWSDQEVAREILKSL